jgi:transposase
MNKKYIVCLSIEERTLLDEIVRKLKGSSQKVRRAQILLKADTNGLNWTDEKIAEAFDCSRQTVENVRERLVTEGFESALNAKAPANPPRAKILSGEQEAQLIAMRLASPPSGYGSWTLRLLQNQMIALEIVDTISHETVRQTLKKTG